MVVRPSVSAAASGPIIKGVPVEFVAKFLGRYQWHHKRVRCAGANVLLAVMPNNSAMKCAGLPEVRLDELVAAAFRRVEDGSVPFLRTVPHPVAELIRNVGKDLRLTGN